MSAHRISRPLNSAAGYEIDGSHEASFPGENCPQCGPWAASGLEYPSVNAVKFFAQRSRPYTRFSPARP